MQAGRIVELGNEVESGTVICRLRRTVCHKGTQCTLLESCPKRSFLAYLPVCVRLCARVRPAKDAHRPGCLPQSSLSELDPIKQA